MKRIALDIETDSLDPTRVWCVGTQDIDTGHKKLIVMPDVVPENRERLIKTCLEADKIFMHNGVEFDAPVLNKLIKPDIIPFHKIVDTMVVARLVQFDMPDKKGHSLEAWGNRLGHPKGDFNDFSTPSKEMYDYCQQDVEVTVALAKHLMHVIDDPSWQQSIRCEHEIARICHQMHLDGFYFDKPKAEELLSEILLRIEELNSGIQEGFPPKLVEQKRLQYRITKAGAEGVHVQRAKEQHPKWEVVGEELVCYDYEEFNPGSPKQRVERLWEAGWEPTEKTKGHLEFERNPEGNKNKTEEERRNDFEYYGWTCSEENLATLPSTAPEAAKLLAQWLTLDGRRSSLVEWLGCVSEQDSRIRGRFLHIGAWTQRLAHYNPNEANIPAAFHGEPSNPVEQIKAEYDGVLRGLWCVPDDSFLVGTDAEGIQLRILAHLLKSDEYVNAIVSGSKEDETDIHNVNKRALLLPHITRDMAKTFIYAFLLGAGIPKVARILNCTVPQARQAVDNFTKSISGLSAFKQFAIPEIARRGYFFGVDQRKVKVPNQHKVLAGMLQAGEACVMKHACIKWQQEARQVGIPFKLLTWPHDEWQTEVTSNYEDAVELGKLQRQSIVDVGEELGIYCPLAGSTDIGRNWNETH